MSNIVLTPVIPLPDVLPPSDMAPSFTLSRGSSLNGIMVDPRYSSRRTASMGSAPNSPISSPTNSVSPRASMSPYALKAEKRFAICLSHDLSKDDLELLSYYGKVLFYDHDIHNNLDPMDLEFDYLIVDTRNRHHRYFYLEHIRYHDYGFNRILHCYEFEVEDLEDENDRVYDNTLISFPMKRATRRDFNILMLSDRVPVPRWYVSLFKCVYRILKSS
jgi:hypothetical protein